MALKILNEDHHSASDAVGKIAAIGDLLVNAGFSREFHLKHETLTWTGTLLEDLAEEISEALDRDADAEEKKTSTAIS